MYFDMLQLLYLLALQETVTPLHMSTLTGRDSVACQCLAIESTAACAVLSLFVHGLSCFHFCADMRCSISLTVVCCQLHLGWS